MTTDLKINGIMKFENSVSKRFSDCIVVCSVFDRLMQSLDFIPLMSFVKYHDLAVRHDGKIISLSQIDIINAVKTAMDAILNEGSSTLILKTLQHVYNLDEEAILREPDVWCTKLKKVCGEHTANLMLYAAAAEIRKLVIL
jgi:hypothetical protein